MRLLLCFFALSFAAFSSPAAAQITPFDIDLTYNGNPQFQAAFDAAEARWESIITGWTDGVNIVSDNGGNSFYNVGDNLSSMFITANVAAIDGQGGILGSAAPSELVNDGNVWLASHGNMNFDSADIANLAANGTLEDVILHEMGHVLGIGTLWTINGLYTNGTGQYTGANALSEYQTEFNNAATFVPVELGGQNPGTANGHWDEAFVVTTPPTGDTVLDPAGVTVIDPNNVNFGRSRSDALMTGFLGNDVYISNTTGGTLQDLGYNVSFAAIQGVPEPSAVVAIAFMGLVGLGRRRR